MKNEFFSDYNLFFDVCRINTDNCVENVPKMCHRWTGTNLT